MSYEQLMESVDRLAAVNADLKSTVVVVRTAAEASRDAAQAFAIDALSASSEVLGELLAVSTIAETVAKFQVNILRQALLNAQDGAKEVFYKQRSLFDRLSEVVYIKDAPFNAKMDGVTDDSAAAALFEAYLETNGGIGDLGTGTLYCKTHRFKSTMATGAFKPYWIRGNGACTIIKFGNISPVLNAGGTAVVTSEPRLFDIVGMSGLQYAPRCRFTDFVIDYTEQVYKGGASALTPALTDIKPLSTGVNVFSAEYVDGIEIENVIIKEVYGNGIILSRCPNSLINNVSAYNVSGGNPGAGDSTGGFIGIMRGSQVGTLVSHCTAINTRVYQTDTIAGYNTSNSKDTMCGYIGIWTEFPINTSGKFAPGTELWGAVTPQNVAGLGCRVESCMVYGYTLGFKMEGDTPCVFDSCIAINCWIPYIGGASQGRIINSYADGGVSDGKLCPQSGYEYVRALFVHYNVNQPAWKYSGFTFDGCMGVTRRTRINTTNCDDGRFLNQQIVIDHSGTGGDVNLLATRGTRPLKGAKVSGIYIVRGLGENKSATILDMANMDLDITVVNLTDKMFTVRPDAYYGVGDGCGFSKIKVDTRGLVKLYVRNSPGVTVDHVGYLVDPALQFPEACLQVGGCDNAVVNYNHTLHSSAIVAGLLGPVEVSCKTPIVNGSLRLVNMGVNTFRDMLFTNSIQPSICLSKDGDAYAIPLILPGVSAKGMHISGLNTGGDASPVFDITYGLVGPITFNDGLINSRVLTKQNLTFEPNHPDRIAKDTIEYMRGISFPYLLVTAGAASGCGVLTGGRRATAWVASTAVTLGQCRSTATNVYKATVAGTTGTVSPTHNSGAALDGTVEWTWLSPKAIFLEKANYSSTPI